MAFHVDYDELDAVYSALYGNVSGWTEALTKVRNGIRVLIESANMAGKGADNIKVYLDSIHNTIIPMLGNLLTAHINNCLLYVQDYQSGIDTGLHAVIDEDELAGINSRLSKQSSEAADVNRRVKSALYEISDLISLDCPGFELVDEYSQKIYNSIDSLQSDITQLEQNHFQTDFINTTALTEQLSAFISERLGDSRTYKSSFSVDSLAGASSLLTLYQAYLAVNEEIETDEDAVAIAIDAEKERIEALNEEFAQRERDAKAARIVLTIGVGIAAAVAGGLTGGLGAAVIIGAASGALLAGGNAAIDQYTEHGWNTQKWDLAAIGTSALLGAVAGAITGAVGFGAGELFKNAGNAFASNLLNNSSRLVRIGSNAVLGSAKQMSGGIVGRFASTLVVTAVSTGDVGKSLNAAADSAFDGKTILVDS